MKQIELIRHSGLNTWNSTPKKHPLVPPSPPREPTDTDIQPPKVLIAYNLIILYGLSSTHKLSFSFSFCCFFLFFSFFLLFLSFFHSFILSFFLSFISFNLSFSFFLSKEKRFKGMVETMQDYVDLLRMSKHLCLYYGGQTPQNTSLVSQVC